MADTQPTDDLGVGLELVTLTGRQLALFNALSAKSARLGSMYLGALRVFADEGNPDRLALAAHGLRELMEKMGPALGVSGAMRGVGMTQKVQTLGKVWVASCEASVSFSDGQWSGEVLDDPLRGYLGASDHLFRSMPAEARSRRSAAQELLRHMDPLHGEMPEPVAAQRVREWMDTWKFFERVCHHGEVTERQFETRLDALETLLQGYLVPDTFRVHDDLDAIIEEAERNADS